MKSPKLDGVQTTKSGVSTPMTRAPQTPKTSFAELLANKSQANAQHDPAAEEAERAKLAQAQKEMGTVLMRGILSAPKMKKLETVQAEDGLNDD